MKNIKFIIIFSAMLLFTGACEDYLEQETFDELTTANFYKKPADAAAGVYAAYGSLTRAIGSRYFVVVEYPGDGVTCRNPNSHRNGQLDIHDANSSNARVRDLYIRQYPTVLNANSVLDNIGLIPEMDENMRNMIIGEARFIRSLVYFNLVRIFQHVPLITSSEIDLNELNTPKTNANEIYQFLVDELTQAISELPVNAPEFGRASKGAAQALLAKVYLTRAKVGFSPNEDDDYGAAADLLSEVINSGVYDLNPDLRNLYGLETWPEFESDNEWIFSIQCVSEGGPSNDISGHGTPRDLPLPRTWQTFHGETPFYLKYDDDDVRKEVFYITEYVLPDGDTLNFNINDMANDDWAMDGPALSRYVDIFDKGGGIGRDISVLKYSDVLLMYAEAIIERDGAPNSNAVNAVNMVRRRAHDYAPDETSPYDLDAGMDYEDFRRELYLERRKELLFEGHAFMDGIRFWDLFKEAVEASSRYNFEGQSDLINAKPKAEITLTDKNKVFPIPEQAIERNPLLEQHELWQ